VLEGPPIDAEMRFAAADRGTRFSFRVHGQPAGLVALIEPLAVVGLRRNFAKYCATLKELLERQPS
jgi:hypothetical protein